MPIQYSPIEQLWNIFLIYKKFSDEFCEPFYAMTL